ncbi:MAG: efflux RND transporter periplasmic adaptor subunit [Legionella sp.]|uniref:efflux RND transporter periplasmic adaptor subunit n=1 Tax=Legionella sp. TaxID=459 RepID=UPI0039E5EF6F
MDIHSLSSTWKTHYANRPQRKQALKVIGVLLILLLMILLCKRCNNLGDSKPQPPLLIRKQHTIFIPKNSPLREKLDVKSVTTSNAPHIVILPGIVEANQAGNISVLSPVTGNILYLNTFLGDEVKKDQVLAVIQSGGFAQAYTDKLKAQSALKLTEEALQRAQKVNRAGANAIKDIEQLKNHYVQAQAELQRAQATIDALGTDKNNSLQIQAPIDGKIIALNYGAGSYINDNTIPLFTLSNINSVWITLCVPENLVPLIAKNQKVDISFQAYPKQSWPGKIAFINHILDSETRCNKSRIFLDNPDEKLKPNMFATVHTQIPQPEQVMVPLSAILMNNDTTSVYVEITPWTFTARRVVLGAEDKDKVRIISGLNTGDRIVVSGGILIND